MFELAIIAVAVGAIYEAHKDMAKADASTAPTFSGQKYLVQPPSTSQPISRSNRQPTTSLVATQPQSDTTYDQWQRISSLPQSGVVGHPNSQPPQLAEGGRRDYLGIQIIGTQEACQRIAEALNYVFADAEARRFVEGTVHTIFCPHLQSSSSNSQLRGISWPWATSGNKSQYHGMIAVDPFVSDVKIRASTIFHEALHLHRQYDDHSVINPMQEAFLRRARR